MCGIAGWLGKVRDRDEIAQNMIKLLHHRGPDAHGIEHWDSATLVHTRLSIIDLSPSGAQPMANEDNTIWTVFNGEIYNHHDIRNSLEARSHVFRGRSDTEVIPHLFEEMDIDFVTELRGMFTIALYDVRNQALYLARDRFGIKPLYYARVDDVLVFASEIRALLQIPDINKNVNHQAISDYAALSFIPAPDTFYQGIYALQPGEILEAHLEHDRLKCSIKSYHQWSVSPDLNMTMEESIRESDRILSASVANQIESDVPLGALLSGGIDSSLVSFAAQEALQGSLNTFNIRFPEERFDETWAAQMVANQIHSNHVTIDMDEIKGTWEHITGLLKHAGQPFADTSLFPTHAVSKLMRRHVTVALSGDGGDEAFGGYLTYKRAVQLAFLQKLPQMVRRVGWNVARFASLPFISRGFLDPSLPYMFREFSKSDDPTSIVQNFTCWMKDEEHERLCKEMDVLPVRRHFEQTWKNDMPAKASAAERIFAHVTEIQTRLVMPNAFLFKVDIASMKESLEVRVPILDEDLFAFALTIPHQLKVNGPMTKATLRQIASRKLPKQVATKPKQGFEIPIDSWVDATFKTHLRENLLDSNSKLDEFFNPKEYRAIIKAFCDGRSYMGTSRIATYRRVIMLLAAHLALEHKTG